MATTFSQAFRYATLPGILPRARDLFLSLTTRLSAMMALAYGAVGLLPAGHPYLQHGNQGRFGVRDVMGAARANLVFRRENADQVILYYTMAIGIVLLGLQCVFLLFSLSLQGAQASIYTDFTGYFTTPAPAGDLAFLMLDHVFGIPGIYGSCVDPTISCPAVTVASHPVFKNEHATIWPTPFHDGMHMMFNFYNLGIACVGLIIFLYLVATTVAETAQSGKPFGERFNRAWAIPRMMLAVALLTPLSYGMNGAQWITLYAAKWGSSLATNAWITFNLSIAASTPLGNPNNLVPNPTSPEYNILPEFMMIARTCKQAEFMLSLENGGAGRDIQAYQVEGRQYWTWPSTFATALANAGNGDIHIVFGEQNADYATSGGTDSSTVKPICGKLTMHIKDVYSPGAMAIQKDYYDLVNTMWTDTTNDTYAQNIVMVSTPVQKNPAASLPDNTYIEGQKTWFESQTAAAFTAGRTAEASDPRWTETYVDLGWAGSSIWYNRIAAYNGSFVSALRDAPQPAAYPEVMESNKSQKNTVQHSSDPAEGYCLSTSASDAVHSLSVREFYISQALCTAQSFWTSLDKEETKSSGSLIIDEIKKIFGVTGLFDMQANVDISPLAQLVAIGRSMIDAVPGALGGELAAIGLGATDNKNLALIVSSLSTMILGICLAVGVLLYYVLPFLPFIYVFFALGGWVKAIFQAMVGLPLWAIAHIRIDGEGIPGPAGLDGYFMIFEIFIRPIIIIFGMVASVSIFSAMVQVLNFIWTLVVTNLTGHNTAATPAPPTQFIRNYFDTLAYTVLYAVTVYMIGLSSFKLIDLMPVMVMRWLGQAEIRGFGLGEEDSGDQFSAGAKGVISKVQGVFGQGIYGLLFKKQ